MDNKYHVEKWRSNVNDHYKVVIEGYFDHREQEETELLVCLDRKKLHFEIEKRTQVVTAMECLEGNTIMNVRHILKVELPKGYEKCRSLQVFNFENGAGKEAYSVPVKKLLKYQSQIVSYVDDVWKSEKGFKAKGWYIDNDRVEMEVLGGGRVLPVTVKKVPRSDVEKQYPESEDGQIVGFEVTYEGQVPGRVTFRMRGETKVSEYSTAVVAGDVVAAAEKCTQLATKGVAYVRRYGWKRTFRKGYAKLLHPKSGSYHSWTKRNFPNDLVLRKQRMKKFEYQPKFSIVVPLYKTPKAYLDEMVRSIRNQTYSNWELCLSDGSGAESQLTKRLEEYKRMDSRIKLVINNQPLKISENTNKALEMCTGDYIVFGDHDDLIAPDALYECVKALNEDQTIDMIYTDEDKVTMNGRNYFQPHFKPDFSIDLLRSMNYICHLLVVSRELFEKTGKLRSEFDGAQDYDFVLRCVEKAANIKHIPKILYHWRAHRDSTAEDPESKRYAFEAGVRAIEAHYERSDINGMVTALSVPGTYRTVYELTSEPLVSIVIPNKDHIKDLDLCIQSIETKSAYRNLEYIIIENNSEKEETFDYYKHLQETNSKVKVVHWKKEFNYSAINNFGVEHATGEYLLFLNNDTEMINSDCISELLSFCQRPEIGIAGAKLYFEDDTIQHAGVIVGLGGVAGHAFVGEKRDSVGYFCRLICAQELSAVTAACMMVKRTVFDEVGGFEEGLAVAFNDIDLCLKVRSAGYLIVYNPFAELYHYESKSRGQEDTDEKVRRFQGEIRTFVGRWKPFLEKGDPYYNPNLTIARNDFSIGDC